MSIKLHLPDGSATITPHPSKLEEMKEKGWIEDYPENEVEVEPENETDEGDLDNG